MNCIDNLPAFFKIVRKTKDPSKELIKLFNWTNLSDLLLQEFGEELLLHAKQWSFRREVVQDLHSWARTEMMYTVKFYVPFFTGDTRHTEKRLIIYDYQLRKKSYNTYWWEFLGVKKKIHFS